MTKPKYEQLINKEGGVAYLSAVGGALYHPMHLVSIPKISPWGTGELNFSAFQFFQSTLVVTVHNLELIS